MTTTTVARAQTDICPGPGAPRSNGEHLTEPTPRPGLRRRRRFPLANLRYALRDSTSGELPNLSQVARATGVNVRQVQRWRRPSCLPDRAAPLPGLAGLVGPDVRVQITAEGIAALKAAGGLS